MLRSDQSLPSLLLELHSLSTVSRAIPVQSWILLGGACLQEGDGVSGGVQRARPSKAASTKRAATASWDASFSEHPDWNSQAPGGVEAVPSSAGCHAQAEFNEDDKAHVLYDDGDEETLDLSEENFKIIDSSSVSELTDETAEADGEDIDRGGDYEENKRGGAVENFLTRTLCERWSSELGQSRLTELAVRMQQRALLDTTMSNYGPKARRFILFCEQHQRPWLPATEATVLLCIASVLGDGGIKSGRKDAGTTG
eukprot:gene28999-biopygen30148